MNNNSSNLWTVSKVVPLPKTERLNEITNYKSIALPTLPYKIFENVHHKKLH